MKIAILSNIINHYQMNIVNDFVQQGHECFFIETEKITQEHIKNGFVRDFEQSEHVINGIAHRERAVDIINSCDVLIGSYYGANYMRDRIRAGRLTFIESERILKSDSSTILGRLKNAVRIKKYRFFLKKNGYMSGCYFLLKGQYAINDYLQVGVSRDRILRHGYFTETSAYGEKRYHTEGTVKLLWVGRMLPWKHPDDAVYVQQRLADDGYDVSLLMIGTGPMTEMLRDRIGNYDIDMAGSVPFYKIRESMHESDIFLFTSDYAEGWGVVLNEAMSEGLGVVASRKAGSTTFLMRDKNNGIVYDGDRESLYNAVVTYLNNPALIEQYGREARKTIESTWNSTVADVSFLRQCERIMEHGELLETDGPCGKF